MRLSKHLIGLNDYNQFQKAPLWTVLQSCLYKRASTEVQSDDCLYPYPWSGLPSYSPCFCHNNFCLAEKAGAQCVPILLLWMWWMVTHFPFILCLCVGWWKFIAHIICKQNRQDWTNIWFLSLFSQNLNVDEYGFPSFQF